MEVCMEAKALKPSLRRELAGKSTQQAFFDDFLAVVPAEDFSVDELFDFSNVEDEVGLGLELEDEEDKDFCFNSSRERVDDDDNSNSNSSGCFASGDSVSFTAAGELTVPDDYLAELEWVSQYVEDSPSELSLLCPVTVSKEKPENRSETRNKNLGLPIPAIFPSPVPSKTRSKRPRPGTRVWSIGSPLSESPSSSSSSSTSTLILTDPVPKPEMLTEPPAKKAKKNPVQGGAAQFQRRCTHCGVHKTPQWRTGPLGPKTLCNACGVRFKSGRLFPEYRPACSPTFSSEIHSNSHRKVLEMRKRKESAMAESELSHSQQQQMVQSF